MNGMLGSAFDIWKDTQETSNSECLQESKRVTGRQGWEGGLFCASIAYLENLPQSTTPFSCSV